MKTISLEDEDFHELRSLLTQCIDSQDLAIHFMASKFGIDSPGYLKEMSRLEALERLEQIINEAAA